MVTYEATSVHMSRPRGLQGMELLVQQQHIGVERGAIVYSAALMLARRPSSLTKHRSSLWPVAVGLWMSCPLAHSHRTLTRLISRIRWWGPFSVAQPRGLAPDVIACNSAISAWEKAKQPD